MKQTNLSTNVKQKTIPRLLRHKRPGDIEAGTAVVILLLALLIVGLGTGFIAFNGTGFGAKSTTASNVTNCSANPVTTTTQQFKFADSAYSGDSALTSPNANVFSPATGWNNLGADNPGSLSSAFTTGGTYSPTGGLYAQYTATGAYPVWAPLNGQPFFQGGVQVLTPISTSGSVANTCVTQYGAVQIAAPGSGTSATTNVAANVQSSDGSSLTTAATEMPDSQVVWTATLGIKQGYKGAGYAENVISTQGNTVVNYQTGQTLPYGASQLYQMVLIVSCNCTNINIGLDSTAPANLQMAAITNPAVTVGSTSWVIWGFSGCAPAPSSVAVYTCLSVPLDIYAVSDIAAHEDVTFIWADMQQPAYIIQKFTNPGLTSFPASGAAGGIPTSFTFLTPTVAPDNGAPTVLIKQSYSAIQIG